MVEALLLLQVWEAQVKNGGDGILSAVVWQVGQLEGVKCVGVVVGRLEVMCYFTSLSKHFIMIGVSAMGWKSLSDVIWHFLGTGMIEVDLELWLGPVRYWMCEIAYSVQNQVCYIKEKVCYRIATKM